MRIQRKIKSEVEKIDFKILDGLRGIAATYVLFHHARGNLFIGGAKYAQIKSAALWDFKEKLYFSSLQLTLLGRDFVILFFIVSGFSIAYSLHKRPKFSQFYMRRLVRIYPPYIVALVWAFVVFVMLKHFAPAALPPNGVSVFNSFDSTIKNIFYIDTGSLIAQFWSLKYEVIFYLLVPFFLMRVNFYFIVSLIIAGVSFFISWENNSGVSILGQYVLDYNIYFAIGIFCFHYYKTISSLFTIGNKYAFYAVAFASFIMMVAFRYWIRSDMNKISLVLASLFSVLLLFNFLHHKIKNKVLTFLGNMSYTIYISHFASIMLLLGILLKTGVIQSVEIQNKFLWLTGIPFALGISYLFYILVEKPTKDLLTKIRKKS